MLGPEEIRHLLIIENIIKDLSWPLDAPLISSGQMDSLDLVNLISILENSYQISLPDDALVQGNFETCIAISDIVSTVIGPPNAHS
jgi:acyl carrier protein